MNTQNISDIIKTVNIGKVLIKQFLCILDTIEKTDSPKLTQEEEIIIWKCLVKGITKDESLGQYFKEALDDYENNVKLEFMTFELKEPMKI